MAVICSEVQLYRQLGRLAAAEAFAGKARQWGLNHTPRPRQHVHSSANTLQHGYRTVVDSNDEAVDTAEPARSATSRLHIWLKQ